MDITLAICFGMQYIKGISDSQVNDDVTLSILEIETNIRQINFAHSLFETLSKE